MATQIILALCEGPHDVAFICKILKSSGFVSNEHLKINQFPQPMNTLMEQEIIKTDVQELNLQQIRQNILPLNTLQNSENYVFLYSMGGDSKKDSRQNILKSIKLNIPEPGEIAIGRLPEGTQFSVVYFFDADNKGLAVRLTEVETEIREVLTTLPVGAFPNNGSFGTYEGVKIGSYIFTGTDNNLGKLEDILVPLMQAENEEIFGNAETFLDANHNAARIFPLKLTIDAAGGITETRSTKKGDTNFDRTKSVIGITGQLQRSGKPKTAFITDTDYLTLQKITTNAKCIQIIDFFYQFI